MLIRVTSTENGKYGTQKVSLRPLGVYLSLSLSLSLPSIHTRVYIFIYALICVRINGYFVRGLCHM